MDKYILKGILVDFSKKTSGGRIYPEDIFLKHIRGYKRKRKIKKILNGQTKQI